MLARDPRADEDERRPGSLSLAAPRERTRRSSDARVLPPASTCGTRRRCDAFTGVSQEGRLGMFDLDAKRKRLRALSKSGCCWHMTEEFIVINNRPKKVLEIVEDATIGDEKKVKIITKRLVNGHWRKTIKYVLRVE